METIKRVQREYIVIVSSPEAIREGQITLFIEAALERFIKEWNNDNEDEWAVKISDVQFMAVEEEE